jgi:hypothetical protein
MLAIVKATENRWPHMTSYTKKIWKDERIDLMKQTSGICCGISLNNELESAAYN